MSLQRFFLLSLLSLAPIAIYSKAQNNKKYPAKRAYAAKPRKVVRPVAGKYPQAQTENADEGYLAPVKELDAKIKQKEQELRRLAQEIGSLKVQRVKLHAETVNAELNGRQRRIDEDEQLTRRNGDKRAAQQAAY